MLDAETRRLLLLVNGEGQPELSLDGLRVDLKDENVSFVLPLLLGIGKRFAQPMNVPRRLARNARKDPQDGVRLQNLLFLIRQYPKPQRRPRRSERPARIRAPRSGCGRPRRWAPKRATSSWSSRKIWKTTPSARRP